MKTREATKKTEGGHKPGNAVDPLDTMKISELQLKFAEVVGEPTRSPNKVFLLRRIKEAISAKAAAVEAAAPLPDQLAATGDSSDTGEHFKPETLAPPSSEEMPAGVSPDALSVALNIAPAAAAAVAPAASEKLSKLDVPALQARYREVIGRETSSENRGYLVWKIRAAQKGNVQTGPRKSARSEGATFKVLPLRMEADLVEQLDATWRRQGLASRMEMFRVALQTYFASVGEADFANKLSARD